MICFEPRQRCQIRRSVPHAGLQFNQHSAVTCRTDAGKVWNTLLPAAIARLSFWGSEELSDLAKELFKVPSNVACSRAVMSTDTFCRGQGAGHVDVTVSRCPGAAQSDAVVTYP